jgi:hypothetical protein
VVVVVVKFTYYEIRYLRPVPTKPGRSKLSQTLTPSYLNSHSVSLDNIYFINMKVLEAHVTQMYRFLIMLNVIFY